MTTGLPSHQLTFDDAVGTWLRLWKGEFKNRIAAAYDVNVWRLYEVWREEKHVGSREVALRQLAKTDPKLAEQAATGLLDPKPKTTGGNKSSEQGSLF